MKNLSKVLSIITFVLATVTKYYFCFGNFTFYIFTESLFVKTVAINSGKFTYRK